MRNRRVLVGLLLAVLLAAVTFGRADAQGRVRATVTLPGDVTVGNHSLTVAGTDAAGRPYAVTSPVVVAAAITTTTRTATINTPTTRTTSGNVESNGLLALTGRTLGPVAAVGALLVVGGGVLTVVARRRQRES